MKKVNKDVKKRFNNYVQYQEVVSSYRLNEQMEDNSN